jgi:hypothetical protein
LLRRFFFSKKGILREVDTTKPSQLAQEPKQTDHTFFPRVQNLPVDLWRHPSNASCLVIDAAALKLKNPERPTLGTPATTCAVSIRRCDNGNKLPAQCPSISYT